MPSRCYRGCRCRIAVLSKLALIDWVDVLTCEPYLMSGRGGVVDILL